MKKLLPLVPLIVVLCACTHLEATSVDPHTGATNRVTMTFVLQKNTSEKLEVAAQTKTTSKLLGAKNTEVSGDVEMFRAMAEFFATLGAKAAK